MTSRAALRKTGLVVAVMVLGGLLILVSREDFLVSGVSSGTAIFRVHVYAKILALILVVLAVCGWVFLSAQAPVPLAFLLMVAAGCYVLSLHNLSYLWPKHELVDHYWPLYGRRLSIVPSDAGLLGVTCSRGTFVARFTNEKGEGMTVFLGIYPWRIDWDRFDEFLRCEQGK